MCPCRGPSLPQADLVVLRKHKRSKLKQFFVGSVCALCARHLRQPLVLVEDHLSPAPPGGLLPGSAAARLATRQLGDLDSDGEEDEEGGQEAAGEGPLAAQACGAAAAGLEAAAAAPVAAA